jgi:Methylase involved in ubiquinone/menaquinone biosynthesis
MDLRQRRRILSSQRDALLRHGYSPRALYWSSREAQELRFTMLFGAGMGAGESLLDVGCGFGDLAAWLATRGCEPDYTGLDLSPELLAEGRRRHSGLKLVEGDLFDLDPPDGAYDWVVLSGTLNRDLGDGGEYARRVIRRMWRACRKGIAFNLLDARHAPTAGRWDLQSFHPDEILALVRGFAPRVELRDRYLENDFTILAWR